MARMSDEAYELKQEIREQKVVANNARNRRGMAGKGGKVRLSSDRLTQKQWETKNGECKSYRMNDPMTWAQFKELPDDLKVCYIKAIRNKYKVPDKYMAGAFGVSLSTLRRMFTKLKLGNGSTVNRNWLGTDEYDAFNNWWYRCINGVAKNGASVLEAPMDFILKKLTDRLGGLGNRKVHLSVSWYVMEE